MSACVADPYKCDNIRVSDDEEVASNNDLCDFDDSCIVGNICNYIVSFQLQSFEI